MTGAPKVSTEILGPEDAVKILKEHNAQNRNISAKTVTQYARAMQHDEWQFVGDPIRFDRGGELLDGQHRLAAVVESGCAIQFVIIRNLEPDSQRYIDTGRKRTVGDQLRIEGMHDANVAAGIANYLLHWQANDLPGMNIKFSTFEVVDFVESNLDVIEAACKVSGLIYRTTRAPKAVVGALYGVTSETSGAERAAEFMNLLHTGAGLSNGSPILLMRTKLLEWASRRATQRPDRHEVAYFLVRTWNAWRKGETLAKLQIPPGGEITMAHLQVRR